MRAFSRGKKGADTTRCEWHVGMLLLGMLAASGWLLMTKTPVGRSKGLCRYWLEVSTPHNICNCGSSSRVILDTEYAVTVVDGGAHQSSDCDRWRITRCHSPRRKLCWPPPAPAVRSAVGVAQMSTQTLLTMDCRYMLGGHSSNALKSTPLLLLASSVAHEYQAAAIARIPQCS